MGASSSPALRVVGDERGKGVEAVFRSFERVGGAFVMDLYEVVLDVGPLVRRKAHAEGLGVLLAALAHDEVLRGDER